MSTFPRNPKKPARPLGPMFRNPIDEEWDFKADWIQCRADAVNAKVFNVGLVKVLAADQDEAHSIAMK